MDNKKNVRVRFAPSPTGLMHLGSVRIALMNLLFAIQKNGKFILRIEDTDPSRNFDPGAKKIIEDLAWLNLSYDEGPNIGGPYQPYFQSKRVDFYKDFLEELKKKNLVYPCCCTQEELEKKKKRQQELKLPPRYDRTCRKFDISKAKELEEKNIPFIWRFKLDDSIIKIFDLAKGEVNFNLKNFSDFAITRPDKSFTFIFANFVDDLTMKISHVLRGEDHLTNTALQAALYKTFGSALPIFCHMPIICNEEGKKLSKRDFGFSLKDLREGGYLTEAICNYLGIIGASFKNEIMDFEELSKEIDFKSTASASQIRYDVEKLKWVNHKWIAKLSIKDLTSRCRPFIEASFETAKNLSTKELENLIVHTRSDFQTLKETSEVLKYYFKRPKNYAQISPATKNILEKLLNEFENSFDPDEFIKKAKFLSKTDNISIKETFGTIRVALTGKTSGLGIKILLITLPQKEILERIKSFIYQYKSS